MSSNENKTIIISGAGLAGALEGVLLKEQGFNVELFEYRDDMRKHDVAVGRSINLALSARGMAALKKVNLLDDVMKIAIPMYSRAIHDLEGNVVESSYSKDGKQHINSVSRGELNCMLMSAAEKAGCKIHFEQKVESVNFKQKSVTFVSTKDKTTRVTHHPELVIGCDGAYSGVRKSMQRTDRFNYSQQYLMHGYKELTIPALPDGGFAMKKNCLHIWPRGTYMMIALPNLDGSFTCTLFAPFEAEGDNEACFAAWDTPDKVMDFFKKVFPDAVPLMPTLLDDYFANPTPSLVTIRCDPWSRGGFAALVGDSAHAIVPFFGQGMNAAFESAVAFSDSIKTFGSNNNYQDAMKHFESMRIANANAIADMAIENFVEMRDKTADENFLFRKEVAHKLGNTFPDKFLARYERVSFSTIPYTEAKRIGELNDKVLDALIAPLQGVHDLSLIDMNLAKQLIDTHLAGVTTLPSAKM